MSTLTDEQFKLFEKAVLFFLDKFNLNNWEVEISTLQKSEVSKDNFQPWYLGACYTNMDSKMCTIAINEDWSTTTVALTDEAVVSTARHEVMELLLSEYGNAMIDDEIPYSLRHDRKGRYVHDIIHRLERGYREEDKRDMRALLTGVV